MTFPVAKIDLINAALALCGDNLCAAPEDGSDEWTAASAAYETAIEYMLEAHDWKGLTAFATLARVGTSQDPVFTDAYAKPTACIHLMAVTVSDVPVAYRIVGNQIVINAGGSGTSAVVKAKFVSSTNSALENGNVTRTFMVALQAFVRAGIYGGLHEDQAAERNFTVQAMNILAQARTRSDQEQPKRAMFNSRLRMARRVPRPWPVMPPGWGR